MIAQLSYAAPIRVVPPHAWLALENAADGDDRHPITFGRFQIWPGARKLLRSGQSVELRSRAFDVLVALVRSRGRVVPKAEIVRHVWPTTTVDESNLRLQVATLRKALAEDANMVQTIPGRGYMLVAETGGVERRPLWLAVDGFSGANGRVSRSLSGATSSHQNREVSNKHEPAPAIAVIDRNPEVREEIRALLEHVGHTVSTFATVEEFHARRESCDVGCIILDAWLPGQSGLSLPSAVAAFGTGTPIIFVSAHADVHVAVQAMKAGAIDFLTKPVRHLDVLDAVQRATAVTNRA